MKTFMEEYGLIVVAAIVIMIFIVVATPVGEALRDGVKAIIEEFTGIMSDAFANTDVVIPPASSF